MVFSGGIRLKKSLIALLLGVALLSAALPAFAQNHRRHHRHYHHHHHVAIVVVH
jgi:hypothetical protein